MGNSDVSGEESGTLHSKVSKAPVLLQNRGLTTYLTITSLGTDGNSGGKSFKDEVE